MEINQVRFGNYSIGNSRAQAEKREQKEEDTFSISTGTENVKNVDADEIFNAMGIAGMQNAVQINSVSSSEIDPADYLSADRIQDIEAMMGEFESGVDEVADVIEGEFPGLFAADTKNALAAEIFAQA